MTDPLKQTPACELDRDNRLNKIDRSKDDRVEIVARAIYSFNNYNPPRPIGEEIAKMKGDMTC